MKPTKKALLHADCAAILPPPATENRDGIFPSLHSCCVLSVDISQCREVSVTSYDEATCGGIQDDRCGRLVACLINHGRLISVAYEDFGILLFRCSERKTRFDA